MKKFKKSFLLLSLFAFLFVGLTACDSDTDPKDTDLFIGKYVGTTSYKDDSKTVERGDGTVTVTKVGKLYSFAFDRGIPDIVGIEFKKNDSGIYVNLGSTEAALITVNKNKLTIGYVKDGAEWTANCERK